MIRDPRSSPQSGRSSHVHLVLALAGVGGLLFFLFSRTSTSRAAPHDGAQAPTRAAPAENEAANDAAAVPELAPALALTEAQAPAEMPALAAEAPPGDATALAAAGSTETDPTKPVLTTELPGPKLKHFRAKGSSNQDLRVSQREKNRANRTQREAAQAQAGTAPSGAEPAKAKDGTKRARWRERAAQVPPSERKQEPKDG